MDSTALTPTERAALDAMAADLRRVFGARLHSVVAYGLDAPATPPRLVHALALVDRLSFDDLASCASHASTWQHGGVAVPLILERNEFLRTLDVFPLEYGEIMAHHVVILGAAPFAGVRVVPADVRRACELSAKSHLIHLREGFIESGAAPQAVANLIGASAPAFTALLRNIARLENDTDGDVASTAERAIGIPASVVRDVVAAGTGAHSTIADPTELLWRYLSAAERVWEYVDTWRTRT